MPELNGEAFVPSFCPALDAVREGSPVRREGLVVRPNLLHIALCDADEEGALPDLDVYFTATPDSIYDSADITPALNEVAPGTPEGDNVAWLEGLDADSYGPVERSIGTIYCERIKQCGTLGGVILRDGKPVCPALDPETLHPIITELRNGGRHA